MFVLTVDQVDSRHGPDRVTDVLGARARFGALLGPDRTAGDEFQMVLDHAPSALAAVLDLTRDGGWSIGVGVGPVVLPLPATAPEASGDAFLSARAGVEAAKRAPHRFRLVRLDAPDRASEVEGMIGLVLELRAKRSAEGWQVADLLAQGQNQVGTAAVLGITPQAVSLRARAAGLRVERAALPGLTRALAGLDAPAADP